MRDLGCSLWALDFYKKKVRIVIKTLVLRNYKAWDIFE